LYKNNTIRHFAALFLLLLFVLGNSPKQWLHDVFANHKDSTSGLSANNDKVEIAQKGIHCQCDHFVVESAFANPGNPISFLAPVVYSGFSSSLASAILNQHQFFFKLRGPPLVG